MEPIISILKLGLPGLVFLLSALSYRLLTQEQRRPRPRRAILKSIQNFLYVNVFLAMLTIAAPIIERNMTPPSAPKTQALNLRAVTNVADMEEGTVGVCSDADYVNRFLLVKDNETQRLIQVFSGSSLPCSEDTHIVLSRSDADTLGWEATLNKGQVDIVSANPGQKFVMGD